MIRATRGLFLGLVLTAGLSVPPAAAQLRFAPELAWGDDHDLAVGARLAMNLSRLTSDSADRGIASKMDFVLPFDWFVDCSHCSYFEVTPGLVLPLTVKEAGPYLGAGLNIARLSVSTEGQDKSDVSLGLGLTGGLVVPLKSFTTFGEVRFTQGGGKQTVVTLGAYLGRNRGGNR